MYQRIVLCFLCASCAPMQTTSTIQRTPLDDEPPRVERKATGSFDATLSLSGSTLTVSVSDLGWCERVEVSRAKMETVTTSYGAREWVAFEAVIGLAGLLALGASRSEQTQCHDDSPGACFGDALGRIMWQGLTASVFVGGAIATGVDLNKGSTKRNEEIETHVTRKSFECRRPAEAGVLVSLVFPGGPALSVYTDQDGRVTFDLGDRRTSPEIWVSGRPLRLISIPARQP